MAGALVAGGVVWAAFGKGFAILHETVKYMVVQIIIFKSRLKSLESTLDDVAPVVQEKRQLSLALGHPDMETKRFIEQVKKGCELVLECSKIKPWSWKYYFKAYSYSIKLKKLNNDIEKFRQIDLTVQNTRTPLETLTMVNQSTTTVLETMARMDLVLEEGTKQNSESKKKEFGIRTLSCAPSESTSNRNVNEIENENETENENENENDIGIVRATNVIPVYSFSPRGKLRRSISSWQKGEFLGSGSFGTVYEGYTEDGYFFAVKEVSLLDQGSQGKLNISYLEQEISLLKQFEHENIVQYLGTEKDESRIYIFLELVTKGSLASLYRKYCLRYSQVSAYTRQILNGLKYLHDKKVIHRDIKCSNILVDASGSVKLADFGLAKVTKLNDIKSCKGTPFWMAPEVVNLKNRFYGLAADIWSLGCTVLEMLTRQRPYSHLEGMQALFMIGKGKPPLVPDSLSRDARDFILKCLQVNPNDRPTATQLLDHPFVTRPQNSFGPASPHNSIQL